MITRCAGQIRVSPMGRAMGLDLGAAMAIGQALGYDPRGLAEFLPAAEVGLLAGCAKTADE